MLRWFHMEAKTDAPVVLVARQHIDNDSIGITCCTLHTRDTTVEAVLRDALPLVTETS